MRVRSPLVDPAVRLVAALASGLLLYLAFPPVGWSWLAPVGAAVLVLACRGASVRRGAVLGLVSGSAPAWPC